MDNKNGVAKALGTTAVIIFVGGFIGGIVLGSINKVLSTDYLFRGDLVFNWSLMLTSWFSCFFAGMFFVGMSEVVDLLTRILLQMKVNSNEQENASLGTVKWTVEKAVTADTQTQPQYKRNDNENTPVSENKESEENPPAVFKSRSESRIECPCCHKSQMSNRNSCYSCGTKFIFSDEQ